MGTRSLPRDSGGWSWWVQRYVAAVALGLTGCLVAVATGGPARAQEKPPEPAPSIGRMRPPVGEPMGEAAAFDVLDSNGDGIIDRGEWRERKMTIFYLLDRDGDMSLTPTELPGLAATEFAAADIDQDGQLSAYEFNQAAFVRFEAAAPPGGDTVTPADFHAYRVRLAESAGAH